jgi:hypothetical protein
MGLISSPRQLRNIRDVLGLVRKTTIPSEELDLLIASKKGHIAALMGIRRLMYHLRNEGLWVSRNAVWTSLAAVDGSGLQARRRQRLVRRQFHSIGPNDVWSCDGYDKLKRYGFPIHGCVDVWSRYLLWLRVGVSNNDPRFPLAYYLDAIEENGGSRLGQGILFS